ncbi:glycosyltransferase [Serratia sp. L9]|uniref:glycosyltransferase n=1 Tax=Serratia sp. L9 TaxID=3423946 RepID=UPI003D67C7A0
MSQEIEFLGRRTDMHVLYRNHNVLVMTSHYEGLPMVISEAFSFALPVIAYDCPTGPAEMISNGENGFLIDLYSKERFVEEIAKISLDAELYSKLQYSALEASSRWDAKKLCTLFYNKLKSIINDKNDIRRIS